MSKIRQLYDNLSVSLKITAAFTIFFLVIITAIVLVTGVCVSYALRHPAEATIQHSRAKVKEILEENIGQPLDLEKIRPKIIPGVVLKIFNAQKELIFDNGGEYYYVTNELFEEGIFQNPLLMFGSEMEISNIKGALVLRTEMISDVEGVPFTFYFFRTVTSQNYIFDGLKTFLMAMMFLLVLLSVTMNEILKKMQRDFGDIQKVLSHKEQFVSTVYHDIKNPLTAIHTRLQMLALYGDDPIKLNSHITAIQNDLQNTFNLVENYRLFTKTTVENFNPSKRLLNLQEILFSIVESALELEKNKNRTIRLTKNDSAQIYANNSLMTTMLQNFLDNAIKYTREGGLIEISSEVVGENVIVKVSDNGIGIPQKDLEKIFAYGYRAKEIAADKKIHGSGIGLATSKMIADIHGIKIDVETVVGNGTTFILTIPLA